METEAAYGDELSLQSAAHLLVREIRVIGEDPEKDRVFQPPESISAECWGAPVFLSYVASVILRLQSLSASRRNCLPKAENFAEEKKSKVFRATGISITAGQP
jgi:hypothetical protein